MNLSHDGLTLHYGTTQAPAPSVADGKGACLTIGVEPPHPGNVVDVRFRVDGGPMRTLPAREIHTDFARGVQYFLAEFPRGLDGEKVEYCPVASCAGRQVPAYGAETRKLSSFVLTKADPVPAEAPVVEAETSGRFTAGLDFLARVTVQLKKPVVIGKTPEGLRIDFFVLSGTAKGSVFNAVVLENTADYMLVRPDGIGLINVRATLRTHDGALIAASYSGTIDFGNDGYERMATGNYPLLPRMQLSPRLLTEDPRYTRLNRAHLLGVGHVDLQKFIVTYDAYAVATLLDGRSACATGGSLP